MGNSKHAYLIFDAGFIVSGPTRMRIGGTESPTFFDEATFVPLRRASNSAPEQRYAAVWLVVCPSCSEGIRTHAWVRGQISLPKFRLRPLPCSLAHRIRHIRYRATSPLPPLPLAAAGSAGFSLPPPPLLLFPPRRGPRTDPAKLGPSVLVEAPLSSRCSSASSLPPPPPPCKSCLPLHLSSLPLAVCFVDAFCSSVVGHHMSWLGELCCCYARRNEFSRAVTESYES